MAQATDIRYAEDTFKSGELAAGFLFDMINSMLNLEHFNQWDQ